MVCDRYSNQISRWISKLSFRRLSNPLPTQQRRPQREIRDSCYPKQPRRNFKLTSMMRTCKCEVNVQQIARMVLPERSTASGTSFLLMPSWGHTKDVQRNGFLCTIDCLSRCIRYWLTTCLCFGVVNRCTAFRQFLIKRLTFVGWFFFNFHSFVRTIVRWAFRSSSVCLGVTWS